MMASNTAASDYFNANWHRFQDTIRKDVLYHHEMYTRLDQFLQENIHQPFSMVDVGCGDAINIAPVLHGKQLTHYIGIDAAPDVLNMAKDHLQSLSCQKTFIAEDMLLALKTLSGPIDIVFSSYAVHHLSTEAKFDFFKQCKKVLAPHGVILLIDCVLDHTQSRDQWLTALEAHVKTYNPTLTNEDLDSRMAHSRQSDFPDSLATFKQFSKKLGLQFQVLVDKKLFAFMVFRVC